MATSTGKTIGLILLVIVILVFALRTTPLILAPLGVFSGVIHSFKGLHIPDIDKVCFGPRMLHLTSYSIFSLVLLIIWIVVIVWVYRDAERRGMNGVLWALLVLIGNLIGLIIYLIVRSEREPVPKEAQTSQTCPSCEKPVSASFVFCPNCGERLQTVCPGCKEPVEKNWKVCPHCGEKLSK
jgi:cbb3-type cytochrome oxidase subunit 3